MLVDSTVATLKSVPFATQPIAPSEIAISVRGIGKMYRIYDRPQDRLKQMLWRGRRLYGHEFWALRNASFAVHKGETIGIIGRNGSGKSTLLQIIAGTLTPTEGDIHIHGRVAALLELGSGFNPEFTGRENVFLNGSILGLSHEEVAARFAEIQEFADIGEFIEQPVKLYSSGMALRLAFAVQAVVPKEILIVDEALAVGDEAFQRKCMRTLEQFRESGGTVLLVSHSAQTIVRQCSRCLFLHNGQLVLDGPSKSVTDIYQRFIYGTLQQQQETLAILGDNPSLSVDALLGIMSDSAPSPSEQPQTLAPIGAMFDQSIPNVTEVTYGTKEAEISDCGMYDEHDRAANILIVGQRVTWRYNVHFHERAWKVNFGMSLHTVDGVQVAGINTHWEGHYYDEIERDSVVRVSFSLRMNIAPGTYYLESGVIGDTILGGGEDNFLHRRVDIYAVRIIPPDSRTISGIAHLEPKIEVAFRK
jgi:lipopolysaccharide transport system ATP-binding protein